MIRLAQLGRSVKVTADDIRYGIPGQADACPVARALSRETGQVWYVQPRRCESIREAARVGPRLRLWLLDYDRHRRPVRPILIAFDSELEVLEVCN